MSGAGQPLALASQAFAEQTGWRKNEELIDALPYIDDLKPGEKETVMRLIEEEARKSEKRPADYLAELPPIPTSCLEGNELMQAEMSRAAAGTKLAALELERYNLNPPPASQRGDPAAWQAALDNAHAQLEHQRNRLLNLELLLKFGPNSWRAHNEALAAHVARVQGEAAAARAAVEDLNRERKLQQTAAGRELKALESEYLSLVAKNAELQAAVERAEAEVAALGTSGGDAGGGAGGEL